MAGAGLHGQRQCDSQPQPLGGGGEQCELERCRPGPELERAAAVERQDLCRQARRLGTGAGGQYQLGAGLGGVESAVLGS